MAVLERLDGREDGRHYRIRHGAQELEVPSVTTILSAIGKPYLLNWAVGQALDRAFHYLQEQVGAGHILTEEALAALCKEANTQGAKENQRILSAAGEFGSVAHDLIESFLQGEGYATEEAVREKLAAYVTDLQAQIETLYQKRRMPGERPKLGVEDETDVVAKVMDVLRQFYAWWEGEGFVVVTTEMTVYSPTAQAAGTLDCLALRGQDLCLLDWKTSNYYSTDYALQTVAYKYFYQELYGHAIGDIYVCRIGKRDAVLQVVHIPEAQHPALFEMFLTVRRLWEWKQTYKHGTSFGKSGGRGRKPSAPPPGDGDAPPSGRKGKEKRAATLSPELRGKLLANPAC